MTSPITSEVLNREARRAMRCPPPLDAKFTPAELWTRAYERRVAEAGGREVVVALEREGGARDVARRRMLPDRPEFAEINRRYFERWVKFLLWQCGGTRVAIAGAPELAAEMSRVYAPSGARAFDHDIFSHGIYREPLTFAAAPANEIPEPREAGRPLGRHLDGCRVGFDLGGSDRKSAALVDGEVVFSEEVPWSPYFEKDPEYHRAGVHDSIARAAAHLSRVDAIGGSAAGVYVNNEVRTGSLYRGVSPEDFERHIRRMFIEERRRWNDVPLEVVNDGEVAALAGSMALGVSPILGFSLGTSTAAGYVRPDGALTTRLNELAFVPVDFRADAPADEWSGDRGCGVQYFSQQAVGRLLAPAGLALPSEMPLPEKLAETQRRLAAGDPGARRVFETVGVYLGYTLAWFARFYDLSHMLLLGRVTSGEGGTLIADGARAVLRAEFPQLAERCALHMPDERLKRHGQAIAAASLPEVRK